MISNEMRKDSRFERHGIRLTSQELVAAMHRRLACHLEAQPLLLSIGYKRFKFETSAPGLPGYYLYIHIYCFLVFLWPTKISKILKVSKLANYVQNLQDERSSWSWLEKTFIADWLIRANLGTNV